jgi:hypothetical protein
LIDAIVNARENLEAESVDRGRPLRDVDMRDAARVG